MCQKYNFNETNFGSFVLNHSVKETFQDLFVILAEANQVIKQNEIACKCATCTRMS